METVLDLAQDSVKRFDRKPFLLIRPGFRTRTTRYRDLGRLMPRVARVLRDRGLQPGDRAIIWAVNRPEWGIAFLGAVHAGIVLVPLDVRSAPDFAAKVAAKMRASLVLASAQTAAQAAGLGLPVLLIERVPDLARRAEPLPAADIGPDDLVEVVFTSGTTGEPKGAMLTHRNIIFQMGGFKRIGLPLAETDEALNFLPLCHVAERFGGCYNHIAAMHIVNFAEAPDTVPQNLREVAPHIFLAVPRVWEKLYSAITIQIKEGTRLGRLAYKAAIGIGYKASAYEIDDKPVPLALRMARAAADAATKAARDFGVTRPLCLGVTVLTSLDRRALQREVGVPASVESHVLHLAGIAHEAGLDGCVASPQEIAPLRLAMGPAWVIVAPGIRPTGSARGVAPTDDQVRVATPRRARAAGADYLVVGRPISAAPDPAAAAVAIVAELGEP